MATTKDATVTSKGQITIPKEIRDRFGLDAGTTVEFVVESDGTLSVRPKQQAMDRLRAVQRTLAEHEVDVDAVRRESKRAWSDLDDLVEEP